MRLPWLIAFLVIVIESLGSLALLIGFATRLSALGLITVMVGAILTSHETLMISLKLIRAKKWLIVKQTLVLKGGGLNKEYSSR
ncbi:MAG: DoxX family protein [Anaerolineales bacterium]|nr:DoxX family protein [Anaerolineales bacterium]